MTVVTMILLIYDIQQKLSKMSCGLVLCKYLFTINGIFFKQRKRTTTNV